MLAQACIGYRYPSDLGIDWNVCGAHYFGHLCRHTQMCYHGDRNFLKTRDEFGNINSVE